MISQVRQNSSNYIWKNFQDADELGKARLDAMEKFLLDYESGKVAGRYVYQSLPNLKFADDRFELCLCSHLLFLYSEQLSLDFHLDSIHELLRIAAEVRIFPLIKLDGELSAYLELVLEDLSRHGLNTQIQVVDYEFQNGGNQMLRITR